MSHLWLPISFPEAPTSAVISVSPTVTEALDHIVLLLVEGTILLVGVVMLQAVDEVQAQAHSEDNETVCIATWSTGVGR